MKATNSQKPKLLVVDDEPDNLDLLYRTFYREFKVLRAENGQAALEVLAQEPEITVVISDQRMPVMSGTELFSRAAVQYPDIMRIILTGYTDVEDLVGAINAGKVFRYITKPWDEKELRSVVQQALETHNLLKSRTRELQRTLRQEALLNAVMHTIRSTTDYHKIPQTIVDTVAQMFEVSYGVLRLFEDDRPTEGFVYRRRERGPLGEAIGEVAEVPLSTLVETIPQTIDVQVYEDLTEATPWQSLPSYSEPTITAMRSAYEAAGIGASLIVPLMARQELLAVLALHQKQKYAWQGDEIQTVVTVADQAALSLAQARTYSQVRAAATREALINTITASIRSSLDPQDIFAAITQKLGQALHVDGCALSLWTEDAEYVQCVGLHSPYEAMSEAREHPSLPQSRVPIQGNPVLQQLLLSQQPVVIHDLLAMPDFNVLDVPLRSPARALLLVPLLSDGRIIGSISLRQNDQPRVWTSADVDLAQAVAAQAAIAVQQSRLYQTTRQQAEKLLELDRQKTEFFQNISHEFRTPLTLIIGPLEAAVAQGQGLTLEQAEIALRNSRRLLRLVNQLLDLQRLDAGRMQPSFRPCNLVDFVGQIVESFQEYCDRKGLQLHKDLQACPLVYLDVERFDKVIYNLLSNAMKFTAPGGQIWVTVQAAGEYCLIKVKDSGIGIRDDQLPRLFERFRQAEGSASRSYEGSGLGLALIKELVELHGGRITVESIYGQGSTFTVWLCTGNSHLPVQRVIEVPIEPERSRAAVELAGVESVADVPVSTSTAVDETAATPSNTAQRTARLLQAAESLILVVDDNPDLRSYVSGVLRGDGYQICTARNGSDGFKVAQQQRPHLIITDLMMPIVSGLDLIRMVRADADLQGTPIVLLTARSDEDTRIEGTELGADAYLSKPFNDRELLAEVRNLLALKANERRVAELNTYLTESVLRRFLPPTMVAKAARGELSLELKPEPRLVTILFSDIIGFTRLSGQLQASRIAELMNEYLAAMGRAVFENGGTVDKFMGDAVLALFGAPEDLPPAEQARRAVATARQMHRALVELNERWHKQNWPPVKFRCGIHQGMAVVGMFGSDARSDYTAIGPSVNIAARMQEVAEPNSVLISAAIAAHLPDHEVTAAGVLNLRGVEELIQGFTLKLFDGEDIEV